MFVFFIFKVSSLFENFVGFFIWIIVNQGNFDVTFRHIKTKIFNHMWPWENRLLLQNWRQKNFHRISVVLARWLLSAIQENVKEALP